ncbi:hypothetical protein PILCRDRAFT_173807 [Piloderma croceum F 1598]|uniref:Uncharacterized protein n=1 Tax=Piloderma croceum (strain F 1598) TaxID=765440 RepID=A0A0C3CKH2_PILCF|nr:hypothetical protein PILCRDRAFT_173807 [Piloderma croceum F 1598]
MWPTSKDDNDLLKECAPSIAFIAAFEVLRWTSYWPNMTISVPLAQLTGTFLETFAYGIYIVIFPRCLDILRKRDVKRSLMSYLLATMWIGFVLITVHVVVDVVRAVQAFAGNMDVPGSPEKYYAIVNTALDRTKTSTYVSETLLADTLLVYRTYIVWGRKYWVVIVPILLLGSDAGLTGEQRPSICRFRSFKIFLHRHTRFKSSLHLSHRLQDMEDKP